MDDRPLGSCDMNSPLKKLIREVIKMPLRLKFTLCLSTNVVLFPLWVRSQGFDEAKCQLGGWIYCCSIVQHKYYLSLLLQQGRLQSCATNTWQEIFPRGQFNFPWQVTM